MRYAILDDTHTVQPIDDIVLWALWMNDADRRVAMDELPNGYIISTVFLGINHGWIIPLWFETMVFHADYALRDLELERYTTWDEAVEGHKIMVNKYNKRRNR